MIVPDVSAHVDELIRSFEEAAAGQELPDLERFIPPPGDPARAEAICELVRVELEMRWSRGQRPKLDEYLERYPELTADDALAAVAFEEYRQRVLAGERPARESYFQRIALMYRNGPRPTPRPRPSAGHP